MSDSSCYSTGSTEENPPFDKAFVLTTDSSEESLPNLNDRFAALDGSESEQEEYAVNDTSVSDEVTAEVVDPVQQVSGEFSIYKL